MMLRRLFAFLRDATGTATIEFALVVPLMVVLFCGSWELSQGVICYLKLIDAADTVVDIVSQQKTLTAANVDDVFTAAKLVMLPNAGTAMGMAVVSVKYKAGTGVAAVDWQQTRGGATALTSAQITTLSTGLGNAGESVIITQVTYNYSSLLKLVLPNAINLAANAMQRPRLVAAIPLN
jgi:Flp pilus assembly protein TadG